MEFTQQDREMLYQIWMSQKAKMRITQMEFAKKLGLTQLEFSNLLRGEQPLTLQFVNQFCRSLHIDAKQVIPTLKKAIQQDDKVVYLQSRMSVDGEIQRAYIEGNQVVVEYVHTFNSN
ncbi:helix-turn-helix domain-containing protein [Vibrio sonorensis]|uniref:helix-turn-helix domain-containing protein n=1 Tax=Vibrio sonorensis TaxID=1004316 RepID=UPI0008D9AB74|nr:helix-turn-helix transcriptional regulator [Vibrio sonorensis]